MEVHIYSIYIHIPFCKSRCSYCDFNTYAGLISLIPDYVEALSYEIHEFGKNCNSAYPVYSIYIGGGTPSLLTLDQIQTILNAIKENFNVQEEVETTIETNPGDVTLDYMNGLFHLGINRISVGMQTVEENELSILGRRHTSRNVFDAVSAARQAGFKNINLDLIYRLPQQTLHKWQDSLRTAGEMKVEHLSLYALTIEEGTPIQKDIQLKKIDPPDPDTAADMYEWSCDWLEKMGYDHYEISNWAKKKEGDPFRCRHNLQYWIYEPYIGFGAGAHGFINGLRIANINKPEIYIQRRHEKKAAVFPMTFACDEKIIIDTQDAMKEMMLVGLRLTSDGVDEQEFRNKFDDEMNDVFGGEIEKLIKLGLLEWRGDSKRRLRLTRRGWLLGNQVFLHFI